MLLLRPNRDGREIVSVAPDGRDWNHVHFSALRLPRGALRRGDTGTNEVVIVLIGGTARIESAAASWERVGNRSTPFQGAPQAVYLPAGCAYEIHAVTDCEAAICGAAARGPAREARFIALTESDSHERGAGNARRSIYDILMGEDDASALFITEVFTPPGHWSSYPPHKHDTDDPPRESALEELYYYRAMPAQGFAFQRIYSADGSLDETVTAHDRDVVLVPRGYHVCAAAAEYGIYYLNVLAGPKHVYHMTFDSQHEWIREGWTW